MFECPFCDDEIPIQPGGWAFTYSQVLIHLDSCHADKPLDVRVVAGEITTKLLANMGRGS